MTAGHDPPRLARILLGNAASLALGRFAIALLRFAVAVAIVKGAGLDAFGQFALLLSFVMIAEWLSDFGLGDIAVRSIAAAPERAAATMAAFAVAKAAQALVAALALAAGLWVSAYPEAVARSGVISAAAILAYGAVQYWRVAFRVRMSLGRDVAAEVLASVFLLGAAWAAARAGWGVEGLALCYALSRAVNLAAAWALAPRDAQARFDDGWRTELGVLARSAVPLGLTGLLVCVYDAMDAIALSHFSTHAEVGVYSVAARVLMLVVMVEQALATAAFPMLVAKWSADRPAFDRLFQAVLDHGVVLAGALFCGLYAGARAIAALVPHGSGGIVDVLQLLAWALLARAIVTLVSPLAIVSGKLALTVWISILVVAAKGIALSIFARDGAIGAALAYVIAEVGVGLVPTVFLCQRLSGVRANWSVPARVAAICVGIAAASHWVPGTGTLLDGIVASLAFVGLALASGALKTDAMQQLGSALSRRKNADG